jgi:hypothetical protein
MSSSAGPASKLALKSSSVGPADKRGRAWDVADDVPPEEEEKSLADRVLTLGPVVEGVRAASEHPKLFDMVLYVTFLALLTYVTLQAQDQAGVWPSSAPYDSARMLFLLKFSFHILIFNLFFAQVKHGRRPCHACIWSRA